MRPVTLAAAWVILLSRILLATPATLAAGVNDAIIRATASELTAVHGEAHASRIREGVHQVAERWWSSDGDAETFSEFCTEQFIADPRLLDDTFERIQLVMEQIDGHLHEVRRELTTPMDLDTGGVKAVDRLFGDVDLSAHVDEDLFGSKVAFLALLNYPVHGLAERLERSGDWNRDTWARSRMMDRFSVRVPAEVAQGITIAFSRADQYIAGYNIRMDRVVNTAGERLFPEGLRLITHWGLRDELKSQYTRDDGLERQRMILRVMERIVRQEIPEAVIDNADLCWAPHIGTVWKASADGTPSGPPLDLGREPDTRYEKLLNIFLAVRKVDPYSPTDPTFPDRRFNRDREIPEKDVEALLISVLRSKEFAGTAALIRKRLGRPLEPFDIWYDGFKSRGAHGEDHLDRLTASRYPDVPAFQDDLPRILTGLGFSSERSHWLADRIVVDPSRGAGHAMGAVRREDQAHLRTRFGPGGMDYKGYNIAVHELGHNVEQVFSLNTIDHWWLNGVPNNAFTEALAFVFQNRDLELLGLDSAGADARHLEALDTLWGAAEIGGVSLVDMAVWRWMYANPNTTPSDLRRATRRIAREVWNEYFAPVFGSKDQEILAIYSHMIAFGLYLPDYPIGHFIAFQVADALRKGNFGEQFERMSRQGRLTPDAWMQGAVGQPVSAAALLAESRRALESVD